MSFWRDKKVFITGHTGFKGSWLTLWLHSLGAKVVGYSSTIPTTPSLFEAARISELCDHQFGDVRDHEKLKLAIQTSQADVVFHLAAQSLVRRSHNDPVDTFSTNIMGTVHVLDAIRECPTVKSCLIVTTDKCYENTESSLPYSEDDRLGGSDPYSNSKACAELVTSSFLKSFFSKSAVGIATARAGNVIGGGDFAEDRIIPDIYRALERNKNLELRNPDSIRPWQHVLVPLSGYLTLAEKLFSDPQKFSGPFNFGPGEKDCVSVKQLITKLNPFLYQKLSFIEVSSQIHESKLLKLNSLKAREVLNWSPHWGLDKCLEETALWYEAYLRGADMRDLSLKQIRSFVA